MGWDRNAIVAAAATQQGANYSEEGAMYPKAGFPPGPDGVAGQGDGNFDCSGLAQYAVWIGSGSTVDISRSTFSQWGNRMDGTGDHNSNLELITDGSQGPGDLVYLNVPSDGGQFAAPGGQPGHVEICVNPGCTETWRASAPGIPVADGAYDFGPGSGGWATVMGYMRVVGSELNGNGGTPPPGGVASGWTLGISP